MRKSEATAPVPARDLPEQLWMVPYARNPFFVGRAEELQTMAEMLNDQQAAATGLALCGDGGVGKTQLVLEYAYLQRATYRCVFWALAETRESLNAAYNDIAELLALPEKGQQEQRLIVAAVLRWLETHPAWLLILDGADDLSLLKEFFPTTDQGRILFTTRAQTVGKLARRLRVKSLPLTQSSRLLLCRGGLLRANEEVAEAEPKDIAAAQELAQQLNCSPLALNLAGAYIAENHCGLAGYQERLRAIVLPAGSAVNADQSDPLLKVVRLSANKGAKAEFAADLLSLCTFLAPDEIPESLLIACTPLLPKQMRKPLAHTAKRQAALNALHAYALLTYDSEAQVVSQAREIQRAWRTLLSPEQERVWAEQTVKALGSIFATVDVDDWEACERLLPHAQVGAAYIARWQLELVEGAWLLHYMGWYLHTRGQYAEAQLYEERALAIYRAVLGEEHPSTAMMLNNLAVTYEDQGKLTDAATLHAQALAIRRSVLGENHLETAASLVNLALVSRNQGKRDVAASLYRQALAIRRQLLGEEHLEIATVLADLAALYADQKELNDAQTLYQQALAIRRKLLGSRHPETITLYTALGETYRAQNKFDEALHWHQQALSAQRKSLGYMHPELAATFSNLAGIYQAHAKLDDAAFWLQHTLALLKNEPGPLPLVQMQMLETLAIGYEEQGHVDKAEALYQQALMIYQKSPDNYALDQARCLYNLASLYHEHKRDSEALPLFQQALTLWQEQRGPNHADTRKAREKYEHIAQKRKDLRAKRVQQSETHPGEQESENTSSLRGIARVMRGLGRKKKSES